MKPADSDPRFHGRRRGRRMRAGRERLLAEVLPRVAVPLAAGAHGADPRDWFEGSPREVWLEIGFGAGEHLAALAAAHPDVGLLGAEPYLNGVARLLAEIEARSLANVRIHPDDARPLLAALAPGTLARVFILFPDPWPKARHHKRRLVNTGTLDALARLIPAGGELRLATDDQDYLVWMLRHLEAHPAFAWTASRADHWRRRPADWPDTRYEAKNRSGGPGPTFLSYRRIATAGTHAQA